MSEKKYAFLPVIFFDFQHFPEYDEYVNEHVHLMEERMPKIIPGLREQILETARTILLEEDDSRFSMRVIADRCSIASGTIYNYFPGKDAMLAAILMSDWTGVLQRMQDSASEADTFSSGIRGIYDAMTEYIDRYRSIWIRYSGTARDIPMQDKRHEQMIVQIEDSVKILLKRHAGRKEMILSRLLSESVLSAAMHKSITWDELHTLCTYIVKE